MTEKLVAYVLGNSRNEHVREEMKKFATILDNDFEVVLSETKDTDVHLHLALGAILDADVVFVILDHFEEHEATLLGVIFGIGLLPNPVNGCRKRPVITLSSGIKVPSALIQGITTAHYNRDRLDAIEYGKIKALAYMGVYK